MAMSSITVAGITPDLNILGAYQRFIFPNTLNTCTLGTKSTFIPTVSNDSITNWEMMNSNLNGFRWIHTTSSTGTFGNLTLRSFINPSTTVDILSTGEGGALIIFLPVIFSQNINMGGFKITNLGTPTTPTDATTKNYVDTLSKPYASLFMAANATTTAVVTAGTYVKVAGTTTLALNNLFTMPVDNRVTYTGTASINSDVNVTLSFTDDQAGYCTFALFKNGAIASSFSAPIDMNPGGASSRGAISISTIIPMVTNDYLEVFVTSTVNTTNITVENLNFTAKAL